MIMRSTWRSAAVAATVDTPSLAMNKMKLLHQFHNLPSPFHWKFVAPVPRPSSKACATQVDWRSTLVESLDRIRYKLHDSS